MESPAIVVRSVLSNLPTLWKWRGSTRLLLLLERVLQRQPETVARIGRIRFPFLSGPRHRAYFFKLHEPEVAALLRTWLRPGDVVLDVGANDGYFTAIAADCVGPRGRVHAFEPAPWHVARLNRLVQLNATASIIVNAAAVADRDGTMNLHLSPHDGWHTRVPGYVEDGRDYGEQIPVPVRNLDGYLDKNNLLKRGAVRLIKIDVEGAEHLAVCGAEQAIRDRVADAFIVEVVPPAGSYHVPPVEEIFDRFSAAGYRSYAFDQGAKRWQPVGAAQLQGLTNVLWKLI